MNLTVEKHYFYQKCIYFWLGSIAICISGVIGGLVYYFVKEKQSDNTDYGDYYENIYVSHKRYEEEDEEQDETDSQYNIIDYLESQPPFIQTEDGELFLN